MPTNLLPKKYLFEIILIPTKDIAINKGVAMATVAKGVEQQVDLKTTDIATCKGVAQPASAKGEEQENRYLRQRSIAMM